MNLNGASPDLPMLSKPALKGLSFSLWRFTQCMRFLSPVRFKDAVFRKRWTSERPS